MHEKNLNSTLLNVPDYSSHFALEFTFCVINTKFKMAHLYRWEEDKRERFLFCPFPKSIQILK